MLKKLICHYILSYLFILSANATSFEVRSSDADKLTVTSEQDAIKMHTENANLENSGNVRQNSNESADRNSTRNIRSTPEFFLDAQLTDVTNNFFQAINMQVGITAAAATPPIIPIPIPISVICM